MPKRRSLRMQVNPRKTNMTLVTETGEEYALWEYPFPELRGVRFKLDLNGSQVEAARTHGERNDGTRTEYTYIRSRGQSLYVAAWLEAGSKVSVHTPE